MLTHHKGLLALTTAGLLLTAATAQTPSKSVERDPFINGRTSPAFSAPAVVKPRTVQPGGTSVVPKSTPPHDASPATMVPAPDVQVSGIVNSGGQRQAILWTGSRSLIVKVGQQVADYQVKAIDANSVTFGAGGKSFRVPLNT